MDAQTKLVLAYLKYDKCWFCSPDVGVVTGLDIGILAVDPIHNRRYHVEVELGGGGQDAATVTARLKKRFFGQEREQAMMDLGFVPRSASRILVSRYKNAEIETAASSVDVEIWLFSDVVEGLRKALRKRMAATDNDGRLLQLLIYPPKNMPV